MEEAPLCLIKGFYKILAKVLVNRVKKGVEKLVSEYYHAFVEDR